LASFRSRFLLQDGGFNFQFMRLLFELVLKSACRQQVCETQARICFLPPCGGSL
jgi:hypothetical protein